MSKSRRLRNPARELLRLHAQVKRLERAGDRPRVRQIEADLAALYAENERQITLARQLEGDRSAIREGIAKTHVALVDARKRIAAAEVAAAEKRTASERRNRRLLELKRQAEAIRAGRA